MLRVEGMHTFKLPGEHTFFFFLTPLAAAQNRHFVAFAPFCYRQAEIHSFLSIFSLFTLRQKLQSETSRSTVGRDQNWDSLYYFGSHNFLITFFLLYHCFYWEVHWKWGIVSVVMSGHILYLFLLSNGDFVFVIIQWLLFKLFGEKQQQFWLASMPTELEDSEQNEMYKPAHTCWMVTGHLHHTCLHTWSSFYLSGRMLS